MVMPGSHSEHCVFWGDLHERLRGRLRLQKGPAPVFHLGGALEKGSSLVTESPNPRYQPEGSKAEPYCKQSDVETQHAPALGLESCANACRRVSS